MKARYILEKFTDESDPIKDMNIGMMNKSIEFPNIITFYEFLFNYYLTILDLKTKPDDILPDIKKGYIDEKYYEILDKYVSKYLSVKDLHVSNESFYFWPIVLRWCIKNDKCVKSIKEIKAIQFR